MITVPSISIKMLQLLFVKLVNYLVTNVSMVLQLDVRIVILLTTENLLEYNVNAKVDTTPILWVRRFVSLARVN